MAKMLRKPPNVLMNVGEMRLVLADMGLAQLSGCPWGGIQSKSRSFMFFAFWPEAAASLLLRMRSGTAVCTVQAGGHPRFKSASLVQTVGGLP